MQVLFRGTEIIYYLVVCNPVMTETQSPCDNMQEFVN